MPYLHVKDFKLGMDRRREKAIGIPGALWVGKNVHITRGGDIEGVKKFVPYYTVADTLGMAVVRGQLFVFGSEAAPTIPAGVQYQRLQANSANMVRVLSAKAFNGKLYVIAQFDDGTIYHFYDGARVTDWDSVSDANATHEVLADYLADLINNEELVEATATGATIVLTSREPGTSFTVSAATVDGGSTGDETITLTEVQANVVAADEVRATATITVTGGTAGANNSVSSVTVGGAELLGSEVPWLTSNSVTAENLAGEINTGEQTHGYSAAAVGAVVTVTASAGASENGNLVSVTNSGDVTTTSSLTMSGGQDAIAAVAQVYTAEIGGTVEVADKFTITVNGTAYYATPRGAAAGTFAHVRDKRVLSPAASLLRFSKLNDPADWTDADVSAGAGFIAVSTDSEGNERLVGAGNYNNQVAVFSRSSISVYNLGADAEMFGLDRVIENTGTQAPGSISAYGNNELFYLDDSGIRSLRARSGTDTPYAADIGSAIDTFVQEHAASLPRDTVAQAVATIEPKDGRFWLAMGDRIYVLSYFPSNKIQAWTYYEPGFTVTDFARTKDRIYARAGDTIYIYGGVSGEEYPDDGEMESVVETPFLSGETPGTIKGMAGADFAVTNTWVVKCFADPNRADHYDTVGAISKITGGQPHIPVPGQQPTWSLTFSCDSAGRRTFSSFMIHYALNEAR